MNRLQTLLATSAWVAGSAAMVPAAAAQVAVGQGASAQEEPKVSGIDVEPPKLTKTVKPDYPVEAAQQGIRGIVILELLIDEQGRVASVVVIRSIPPLDEAAVAAAKKWEFQITKVDGKPVRVRHNVPVTFLLRLPEMTRGSGIPELRQGGTPVYPRDTEAREIVKAVAELTVSGEGRVTDAEIKSGSSPWTEALLSAVRGWLFVADMARSDLTFRVEADFIPASRGAEPRVALALSGLQRTEAASATPEPPPPPQTGGKQTEGEPTGGKQTGGSRVEPLPSPPPVPSAEPPKIEPGPAPPAVEVLRTPPLPDSSGSKPARTEPALSTVRDVTLALGVPELAKGRRPLVPPLARMAGASGTVTVRFAIDPAGQVSVQSVDGPDVLRAAAEQTVASWSFRRTSPDRLHALAQIVYQGDNASASIKLAE